MDRHTDTLRRSEQPSEPSNTAFDSSVQYKLQISFQILLCPFHAYYLSQYQGEGVTFGRSLKRDNFSKQTIPGGFLAIL